ncbi:MAG: hypothetical protein A2946_00700 [Candidatus Liptonbacteria bacterium RIFCSPLOWO2_01_FULL_53_13]|uniref:Uncharacterized protein n=1 Tax=Candidatus Liptonbacteria bacterium RIFCSPLOWO2_01_FULL_53_13 TaxID=1798651 RepID=A0A1G2CPE5_9BACT|nr:MAG: hypothetical protein A2946_00700 [Candidatus Liptonbacteria bacterium RIFCSPLOWO2_01_FULL_53_13]
MTASLIALLGLTASLLANIQANPALPPEVSSRAINTASQVLELALRMRMPEEFMASGANTLWPSYNQLISSRYLTADGTRVIQGGDVKLLGQYTSFGDLNGDHMDDAVVVVLRAKSGEERADNFAVMLNQGNGLFNASVLPLQKGYEIFSHRIENEQFDVDMKLPGKDRKIYHYKLVGTELVEF